MVAETLYRPSDLFPQKEIDPTTVVVVTGMGAIGPLGIGRETMWKNLKDGKSGIVRHVFDQEPQNYPQIKASIAGMVPEEFNPEVVLAGTLSTRDIRNRLHRSAQFSLAASYEALQQAGLLVEDKDAKDEKWKINSGIIDPSEIAAIIGTGIAGGETIAKVQLSLDAGKRASPSDILHTLPERVVTTVTMAFGIKGTAYTIVAACATGNVAIASGIKEIMSGDAKAAVVGSAEAMNVPVGYAMFDGMRRALDPEPDPQKAPRPFDRSAAGLVMGEGAGILVLERLDVARARGAKVLAVVSGYGIYSDAHHDTEPSGEGGKRALLKAIDRSLEDSKTRGRKYGRVYNNLHGTGTPTGDPMELRITREAYTERKIDVAGMSSTKSSTGHCLGAANAIEAVFCIKALEDQVMPPTLHLENPIDEAEGLNLVPKEAQVAEFDHVHSNGFGFGGLNAIVVFSRV